MSCFRSNGSKTPPPFPTKNPTTTTLISPNNNVQHQLLLSIPQCNVHFIEEGEAFELANGDFELVGITDQGVSVATIIKVGDELQWPLTKDEPIVKVDALHYLFSLPMKEGSPLSYGVGFSERNAGSLGFLDSFLKDHALLTTTSLSSSMKKGLNWKEFAPRVDDYNNVLAKAIAGGTGHIVKGIFKCSNAYTNQVHKGGEMILIEQRDEKHYLTEAKSSITKNNNAIKKSRVNKSLKRVRKLSKMTEKMSKTMLDGVGIVSGSIMRPVVRSQAGKSFFNMVPGEVLLASLDAVNKIIDAAEAAEKQTMSTTSGAVNRMVTQRYGENGGEAVGDAMATAGHCFCTAWNVFKIRKAINPASSVPSGVLKNAAKRRSLF